jgi:S-adenosylmethionine:tRNA ribosyltransferase-isomerase
LILPSIHIDQYFYDLPEERIAKFPLANRDESQLLLYNKHGISHTRFSEIDQCIPPSSLMVWNDTRVIQARLSFHKASGAQIEVFLLEPAAPADYSLIFNTQGSCSWYCLVGNKKRWRDQSILTTSQTIKGKTIEFHAELEQDNGKESRIKLSWNPIIYRFMKLWTFLVIHPSPLT